MCFLCFWYVLGTSFDDFFMIFDVFRKTKKDARRPYDHFGGGIAPRSLLCVRKQRFPFLKKDIIWSVICPRNLLPGKCPSDPTSTCAGGQDDVSSQVNSLKKAFEEDSISLTMARTFFNKFILFLLFCRALGNPLARYVVFSCFKH